MGDQPQQPSYSYIKRPLWQWILLYLVLGALVYGLVYYFVFAKKGYNPSQTGQYQAPTTAQQATTAPTAPQATNSAMSATKVTIAGTEFAYSPSSVTVKKGETVTLTFKNSGAYPHNLTISELGVATKTVPAGGEDTITFTANKVGSFDFQCTIDSHAAKGMKGTLVVQ